MLEKGVYVIAFCYPDVPHGTPRVRTQTREPMFSHFRKIFQNFYPEIP
jgi:7-keto-8-aminopelargonate synthetase-like enzyme